MIVNLLFVLLGLAILVVGGNYLVKGAVNLSLRLGISPLVVGLTVVAFGTSAPELIVSVSAVFQNAAGIALGNVVGSNIANVLLVLGVPAVISGIVTKGHDLRESWAMMIAASLMTILLCFMGPLYWPHGLILLASLGAVLWRQVSTGQADPNETPEGADEGATGGRIALWLIVGLIALPVGAQVLVQNASEIARAFGVSETVIGLTLVAIGTSLPELATSVSAALKGRADLALGNVVGSNLFNLLGILGATALIGRLPVPPEMLHVDLWVMLATSLLVGPFLLFFLPIGRVVGAVFLALYAAYMWVLI